MLKRYKALESTFWEGQYYKKGEIIETENGKNISWLKELPGQEEKKPAPAKAPVKGKE